MWSDISDHISELKIATPSFCAFDHIEFNESPSHAESWKMERFPHISAMPLVSAKEGKGSLTKPIRVGVVFSGGPASGGHNVICGLFDSLKKSHQDSTLVGFRGGPQGIIDNVSIEITKELCKEYKNQGGFDLLGTGRTKIENEEQFTTVAQVMKKRGF